MIISLQNEELVECGIQTEPLIQQVEIPINRTSAAHRLVTVIQMFYSLFLNNGFR